MLMPIRLRHYSILRAGRLTPPQARILRARAVRLLPAGVMDWHSTQHREELLIALDGTLRVELAAGQHPRAVPLRAGECTFLPPRTLHRVINRSRRIARYVYVTGGRGR
jgi:mannose-6-phosphate isomerase-like protein (cupin superfamily)